jgi:hypothetical protein
MGMFIPTLEIACLFVGIAAKCYLWPSSIQDSDNILICNVAHLEILVYNLPILVADSPVLGGHHGIAGFALRANVDACPSFFTFTVVALPHRSISFGIC